MNIKEISKKIASAILFFMALIILLGGYIASYTAKSGSFAIAGVVLGIVFITAASMLANLE